MTFQQLTYFYHAAKTLSFSKAASNCFVAQTAVSKQIQNLESELGCMLFDRSGKQLELTVAGDNLRVYAERIINLWNDSIESTKRLSGTTFEKSDILVGYWGCVESVRLTSVFNSFLRSEPNSSIYYTHLSLNGLVNCLLNKTVDLLIAPKPHFDTFEQIETIPVIESRFGVVLPEDHPLSKKETIKPLDIAGETFIQRIITASAGLCTERQKVWDEMGFFPKNFIEVNEYKSAIMMVASGMGLCISPEYVEEMYAGGLQFRYVDGLNQTETLAIGYLQENDKPVVQRFIKHFYTQH